MLCFLSKGAAGYVLGGPPDWVLYALKKIFLIWKKPGHTSTTLPPNQSWLLPNRTDPISYHTAPYSRALLGHDMLLGFTDLSMF